jgi:ABC-type lipopolysaccharide export system ATPase subunit
MVTQMHQSTSRHGTHVRGGRHLGLVLQDVSCVRCGGARRRSAVACTLYPQCNGESILHDVPVTGVSPS